MAVSFQLSGHMVKLLPPQRDERVSQIRDHLQEALRQTPPGDTAAVRNVLERLGPPEEIAAAADPTPWLHLMCDAPFMPR
jgi:hypothetical protein